MAKSDTSTIFNNRKAEDDNTSKHIIYWILIAVCVVIMWFIVNGLIHKLLVLY